MAPIPEQQKMTPEEAFFELQLWWQTAEQLTQLRNKEAAMRKRLAGYYFAAPNEGVNKLDLGNGFDLVLEHKFNRSVDEPALNSVKAADIKRLGLPMDDLFVWKPSLVVREYRDLSAEQLKFIDALLDIKEAMPSMHIKKRGGEGAEQLADPAASGDTRKPATTRSTRGKASKRTTARKR